MKQEEYKWICKVRIKTKVIPAVLPERWKDTNRDDKVILRIQGEKEFGVVFCSPKWEIAPSEDLALIEDVSLQHGPDHGQVLFRKEKEIEEFCKNKASQLNLEMEILKAEYTLDSSKTIVYFTAEKRIDFRELVKEINNFLKNKTKIELWQISSREKAVLIGGLGICGREICCRSLQKIPETVSIRTVKDQHLDINPLKITGLCGKLMCCLTYEHQTYCEIARDFPKIGTPVRYQEYEGTIKACNYIKGSVVIGLNDGASLTVSVKEIEIIPSEEIE